MTSSLPRIGVSLASNHRSAAPTRMIERARTAHQAGLISLTLGDHHDMKVPYAQNTPMLGRLLAEWTDRPVGCLFLTPLWKPLLMAEHIGTLAAIHHASSPNVPFIVQTGIGWGDAQFANLGANMSHRGRDIDAAIPAVKALLAGETVTDAYFGLVDATVGLRSSGPIEWWIGGTAEVAIDRAARLGDCWYGSPGQDDESIRVGVDRYRSAGGSRCVAMLFFSTMLIRRVKVPRVWSPVGIGVLHLNACLPVPVMTLPNGQPNSLRLVSTTSSCDAHRLTSQLP